MVTLRRSYSSVVVEDPSTVRLQVLKLIDDGKSDEFAAYICDRRYACNLLTSMRMNPSNNEDLSLLMIATLHGHDTIVREILSHSLDRTKTIELEGRVRSVNGHLVNSVTALWCALDRAHFTVARTLIDLGKANVNHGPFHPLLIDATIRGRLDIIQFLIENDYVDVNQTKTNDENKSNSLIVSVWYNHTQIIDYLIKKNVELESKTCVDQNTALAIAAMKGHLESVRLLTMAGASSRTINHAKKTPIVLAVENDKFDVMNYLLEHDHNNASFDDLELVAASHILSQKGTKHCKSQWVIELLRQSLLKRTELNIPKSVAEPMAIYDFQQECQSIDEFDQIQDNDVRLYIEALLIQERILLSQKDEKLFTLLFERATTLVEKYQFDLCLDLILHIFHLSQQFQFQNYFKQFFWLFYNMFNSKIQIPVDRFWEIYDLIFKPSEQNHMRDASYLWSMIGKIDPPEISLILNELKLNDDCVANIYFHGSYAQGTCTQKSDRDLIIVTRSYQMPLRFQRDFDYFHQFELHKLFGKYDVCVYSLKNFKELLKKNYLLCVQCLFLPDQFKIKEEIDFRKTYLSKYYDPIRIKKVAFYEMFTSLNMIDPNENSNYPKRSLNQNEEGQSREDYLFKNLFHGIRFLDMAQQLIQTRSIFNLKSVSHLLNTMKDIRNEDQSNMERVIQFVCTKSTEFKSKLDSLIPTNIIKGRFQVHITFDCNEQIIEKLKIKCQNTKYKIAFIYLCVDQNKNKLQIISSYYGEYPLIIQQIQEEIHQYFQDFNIEGIQIKSLLSNEGLPRNDIDKQLFWNEKHFCFQFHYRILLKQEFDQKLFQIIQNKCKFNIYLSPYIIKRIDHKKFHYMTKMSLFDVGQEKALDMNNQYVEYLRRTLRLPSKIQFEFIIYDTNIDLMKI